MQSRANIHHDAVLIGKLVKSNVPKVFVKFSSNLVTKFGIRVMSVDIAFNAPSTSFKMDCNRSPDACALRLWDSLRPDDDDASCCSLLVHPMTTFQIWTFWFRDFWIPYGTWEMQSVAQCLAWILLALDIELRLFLSWDQRWAHLMSHCSHRENSFAYWLWLW